MEDNWEHFGGQLGTLYGLFEKHFSKVNQPKNPEIYLGLKSFRTVFENGTPVYSLAAPLLGLARLEIMFFDDVYLLHCLK